MGWRIYRSDGPDPSCCSESFMSKAREFIEVFRLYAKHHNPIYAARMAYGIVVKQLPF